MIFHASVPADDPERVAKVIAELWGGEASRFPPWPGAYVAMADDDRGSTVEVYPRRSVISPGEGAGGARPGLAMGLDRRSTFHLAIATHLSPADVLRLADRESWRAVRCSRGGLFDVIELWLENAMLLEVMTAEMQSDYRSRIRLGIWRRLTPAASPT